MITHKVIRVRHIVLAIVTRWPIEYGWMKSEVTPVGGNNAGNPLNPDEE